MLVSRSAALFRRLSTLAALVLMALPARADALPEGVFARVGEVTISVQEFDATMAQAARQKFYHGKPPEGDLAKLQREVADKLVNGILILKEARKRGVEPDRAEVQKVIDGYEQRYKGNPRWEAEKGRMLPGLIAKLEEQSLLTRLEQSVRQVPAPDETTVRAFYDKNPELFTEPAQDKVSAILLKVDPASTTAVWEAALKEGQTLVNQLKGGADFAEMARLRSADPSAEKGGDMGYLHRGMLPDGVQQILDKLKPGELTDAVRILEGVGIFRLDERKPARKAEFAAVRERAAGLWQRQAGDAAWQALISRLRSETTVQVDESRYLPLPASGDGAAGQH